MISKILAWLRWTGGWDIASVSPPWGARPSIYAHVRDGGGETLPDDAVVYPEGAMRWVAGGLDGAFGHHGAGKGEDHAVERLMTHLTATLRDATADNAAALYDVMKSGALGLADATIERLGGIPELDVGRLHAIAVWLAKGAADREAVKMAIALLGAMRSRGDRELIMTLGRHEEFTLYSAVAIGNTEDNPERSLWELAKAVGGWGRIQTIERLAQTNDPEIRAWLLRDAHKGPLMFEYVACTCAETGGLREAMAAAEVDEALLLGAGVILEALFNGGPAENIDDYADAAHVVRDYLRHIPKHAPRLATFLVLKQIESFLADGAADWTARAERGWHEDVRRSLLATTEALVSQPHWRTLVEAKMSASDSVEFWQASRAAPSVGIDPWPEYFARTEAGGDHWFHVMQTRDEARAARVVQLALDRLPLAAIATGPGKELGMGAAYKHHGALDFVLQELGRFPGLGWPLIAAGLRSPVIRNRNMALRALEGWGRAKWPAEADALLRACQAAEPDDAVRNTIRELLGS